MLYSIAAWRKSGLVFFLFSFLLLIFSFFPGFALSSEVMLAWVPNSEENLAGYKIHYGTVSLDYTTVIDVGSPTVENGMVMTVVENFIPGTTYFLSATAYDSNGLESDYCPEIVWECPVSVPVNNIPVASDTSVITSEENVGSGNLLASDADNDVLTYTLVSDGSLGSVVITGSTTGAFIYSPLPEASGSDSFTFKVNDGQADSNIATVTVEIEEVNDSPFAEDGFLVVNQGEAGAAMLVAGDIDSDHLSYTLVSEASLGIVAIDADSGSYTYTPFVGAVGEDQFSFQVSDGQLFSNTATVQIDVVAVEPEFAFELGEILADGSWLRVAFDESFIDPVVIAKPAGNSDVDPCVVQIRNVDYSGFDLRLKNWDYLAYEHGSEMVGFVVMERGSFVLPNGLLVEAGYFTTNETTIYENVAFAKSFNQVPVVVAGAVTVDEDEAVAGRLRDISVSGFNFRMQEQELNIQEHDFEKIAYFAWEPGIGIVDDLVFKVGQTGDLVTHAWFDVDFDGGFVNPPVFLADMQSTDGRDTSNLRYDNLAISGVKIKVSEEQSKDSEVSHTTENVGFMALDLIDSSADFDSDGLSFADEFLLYSSNPAVFDSDGDGFDDGSEVNYWGSDWSGDFDDDGLVNLLDPDADGDGYADGVEFAAGYDPGAADSWPGCDSSFTIEFGDLELDSQWQHVTYEKVFANPVVVVRMVSKNGSDPGVVRLKNVDTSGFDLRLQEWDYLDGNHKFERVTYIVLEGGSYTLADGTMVEAGYFDSSAVSEFDQIDFKQVFNVPPVVVATVASVNEEDAVCSRLRTITAVGMEFKLQEQEVNSKAHAAEKISFIAWEPSAGTIDGVFYEVGKTADGVKHKSYPVVFGSNFSSDPILVADMQTTDGGDTSVARCEKVTSSGFEVFIEEEKSRDTELNHITEVVGYIGLQ